MSESLNVLLVEDNDFFVDRVKNILQQTLANYQVLFTHVSDHQNLRASLESAQYGLAMIDFDLRGGYEADARRTVRIIDSSQPSCIRIGYSLMPKDITKKDPLINDIFHRILDWESLNNPKTFKKVLEEFGFS